MPTRRQATSFDAGHRIRIEVSSSNFPRFDRNMNTGGKNYDESEGVVAHNAVHHWAKYPATLKLTVVKRKVRRIERALLVIAGT
jgi:predicted acyl esterase